MSLFRRIADYFPRFVRVRHVVSQSHRRTRHDLDRETEETEKGLPDRYLQRLSLTRDTNDLERVLAEISTHAERITKTILNYHGSGKLKEFRDALTQKADVIRSAYTNGKYNSISDKFYDVQAKFAKYHSPTRKLQTAQAI